jgi:hypothetical protein
MVAQIPEDLGGLRVTIQKSKTDQEGQGITIAIIRGGVACPVAAVKASMAAAGISEAPVFRLVDKGGQVQAEPLSRRSISRIVKEHAERSGLDPEAFAGHCLRSGFLPSAAARGASIFKMMDVSQHRSVDTLRG